MMQLSINGELKCFDKAETLQDVMKELKMVQAEGLAVAVNDEVVARNQWKSCRPQDGSSVTVIRAVQGG